jgi:ferredoxin
MPTVTFRGHSIECDSGAILRDVLQSAYQSPHNGRSKTINCHGLGTCGTCAVAVTGDVSESGRRERARLSVPPHDPDSDLRLACQTRVYGDVTVEKYPGFWGQHTDQNPE